MLKLSSDVSTIGFHVSRSVPNIAEYTFLKIYLAAAAFWGKDKSIGLLDISVMVGP